MSETTTTEDEVKASKIRPDLNRSGLHVRITEQHHNKLQMLVREPGRSRRDIVELLIDMAKVGEYTQ